MDRKRLLWDYVTADRRIEDRPCWLHYAELVPVTGAETATVLYDGDNTSGKLIITLKSAAITNLAFRPAQPVFCQKGLYLDVGTNTAGVFVQWEPASGD